MPAVAVAAAPIVVLPKNVRRFVRRLVAMVSPPKNLSE
jgi:hypothetical protein